VLWDPFELEVSFTAIEVLFYCEWSFVRGRAALIALDVAEGLAFLHSQRLIHLVRPHLLLLSSLRASCIGSRAHASLETVCKHATLWFSQSIVTEA
jgi:hypothetical protein